MSRQINQQAEVGEEKLVRRVTGVGNGAHIFMPKEWINEDVIILRQLKRSYTINEVKEEIMKLIYPYLDKITGVFLFGSYAKGEQTEDSDIDIFIISNEKLKIKKSGFDIISIEKDSIEKALKLNPVLFYAMLNEAKPIINSSFLNELKVRKIDFSYFKDFIRESKKSLKSDKELIELDKEKEFLSSNSVIYSLVLRLRGVFIIKQLLKKEKLSNENFKKWIKKNIPELDYEKAYYIYRAIRDDKKSNSRLTVKESLALLKLLEKELKALEKN